MWGTLSRPQSSHQSSWIDQGLRGAAGAHAVLASLQPETTELCLSHNRLGDVGVLALCEGLIKRQRAGSSAIVELNLTSNEITDQGFYYVVQHLLLASPPPKSMRPALQRLYLSNNAIFIAPTSPLPALLSAALSHPSSRLHFLSLISNEGLHLDFLKLLSPTALRVLQVDTCGLHDSTSLARFLRRVEGGGRLEQLRANGNYFGEKGVRKLASLVARGQNTSLCRFELSANSVASTAVNSRAGSRSASTLDLTALTRLPESEDDEDDPLELENGVDAASVFSIPGLTKALSRNVVLREMTQLSALRLLPYARILLLAGLAHPLTTDQIKWQVCAQPAAAEMAASTEAMRSLDLQPSGDATSFPWLALPSELHLLILSHLSAILDAERALRMRDLIQSRLQPAFRVDQVLSKMQRIKLVEFAAQRSTLLSRLGCTETLRAMECERWVAP